MIALLDQTSDDGPATSIVEALHERMRQIA